MGERLTGAGRVVQGILAALPQADPEFDVHAFATAAGAARLPGASVHVVEPGRGVVWELRDAARAAEAVGAELLFTVRELVGRRSPPTVLHLFEPPRYRLRLRLDRASAKDALLASLNGRSLSRAAAVTAGSATTAGWLRRRFGVEATVVLPGLADRFFEAGPAAERPRPYLFHVAGADARDDTDLVLGAVRALGSSAPDLVVAGVPAARREILRARAAALGIGSRVDVLDWVDEEDLLALYRGAFAFVHPSRYEAYGGLPALEAMALGTPVVAFDAPGVTEALDGAAILVEAPAATLLAAAIGDVAADPELRQRLSRAGRLRVDPLRWERAAAELAGVFRRVLA